ncbi:MAG: mannose-1-phosphate guanylyltransferase/mannose-6-phosphate isomerase [Proteobacteria bacterium]|nr:mannose-1-phosphate guanylyltransferase/mannose-6-phosphate isomerase [Pseudomonadota bacterium]
MTASALIHPVIMSGGVGSRLWPLSRSQHPKQFLPLAGKYTLIQDAAERVSGAQFAQPSIVCNDEHRFLVAEQLRELGIQPSAIILEPAGRNTAPAIAAASLILGEGDSESLVLAMPADHVVADRAAFLAAVEVARPAALRGAIVTFGIAPTKPETGYGYVQRGDALEGAHGVSKVSRFVEKPDVATAERYLQAGTYFWNSGIFLFKASTYLAELQRFQPEILSACKRAVSRAKRDMDFLRLDETAFKASPSKSIDYAVMEHTSHAAVVPVEMGWNDIGSWHSMWESSGKDDSGNAIYGDVIPTAVRNSYLRSDGPLIAAVGVDNLVVVASKDAVLVASHERAQDVKAIVEELERRGSESHIHHPRVLRPWGSYESLENAERFQVKRLIVNPGARLSLQRHKHRAEHWVVVSGTATVTCDERTFELHENESTFIPLGAKHRLANQGREPLQLIEVQSGAYLGEDDIERFSDDYGR